MQNRVRRSITISPENAAKADRIVVAIRKATGAAVGFSHVVDALLETATLEDVQRGRQRMEAGRHAQAR